VPSFYFHPKNKKPTLEEFERVTLSITGARLVKIGCQLVVCRQGCGGASCGAFRIARGGVETVQRRQRGPVPLLQISNNRIQTLFLKTLRGNGHMSNKTEAHREKLPKRRSCLATQPPGCSKIIIVGNCFSGSSCFASNCSARTCSPDALLHPHPLRCDSSHPASVWIRGQRALVMWSAGTAQPYQLLEITPE